MFGDPFNSHSGAAHIPLHTVIHRITYGFTNPMKHIDSGIPILTAKNVQMGSLDLENVHYALESEFEALTDKSKPMHGDVLVTKDGTIGRCAVVETTTPFCINQSIALLKPDVAKAYPEFIAAYLRSSSVQRVMKGMKKGNALAHLQITELANLPFPDVPLCRQAEFIRRSREVGEARSVNMLSVADLDALFAALQSHTFRG
jgi:type I restriction enzyme S subunit